MSDPAEQIEQNEVAQHMLSLRALARLLDYPTLELQQAVSELVEVIDAERRLGHAMRARLGDWCRRLAGAELLDLQAEYVGLFDKGRSTSLLLFEHVHGESRDRGQAMVDLMAEYHAAGFVLDARELPDYLPLFLEYLSTRDEADIEAHRPAVAVEAPDHTPEALDAVWEEEAVRFSADSDRDCALQSAEGRRLAERKREQPAQVVNILSPTPPAAGQ